MRGLLAKARAYATHTTSNLRKPAFPLKDIVANAAAYQRSVDRRGVALAGGARVADVVAEHERVLALKKARQRSATERNRAVEAVKAALAAAGRRDELPAALAARSAAAKRELARLEAELAAAQRRLDALLASVPNLVAPEALALAPGEARVVRQTRAVADAEAAPEPARDHLRVGAALGILDVGAASKVCGSGNAYLVGAGALLEQALVAYALQRCRAAGFEAVSPPSLVRPEFVAACGFQPRDDAASHVYRVAGAELCLAGTAEIPLAAQRAETRLAALPQLRCGAMRSFRAEPASKGADTRGLYRLHEFTKVELFAWTAPADSPAMLARLVALQEAILGDLLTPELGVPLRTIDIPPDDLGAPAFRKFDIEAWLPGRGAWGELSSASDCRDFQSRRLHTLDADGRFVHTLNATALAVPRVVMAILEHGWEPAAARVRLPRVLHPFLGEYITAPGA